MTDKGEDADANVRARRVQAAEAALVRYTTLLGGRADDLSNAVALLLKMDADSRQSLAQLAATTTDADVYALAVRRCHESLDGNCQTVTPERWAELAPSNAVPWLHVADAAMKRKDAAAVDAAMARAAEASDVDEGEWRFFAPLMAAMPADADPAQLEGMAQLTIAMIGVQAGWSHRPVGEALRAYCLAPGQPRAPTTELAHLPVCERLAELMATRSRSLLDRYRGFSIGAALGWPKEHLMRARSEREALSRYNVEGIGLFQEAGCDSRRTWMIWLRDLAEFGEAEALGRRMRRAGLSMDELIERQRRAWAAQLASSVPANSTR